MKIFAYPPNTMNSDIALKNTAGYGKSWNWNSTFPQRPVKLFHFPESIEDGIDKFNDMSFFPFPNIHTVSEDLIKWPFMQLHHLDSVTFTISSFHSSLFYGYVSLPVAEKRKGLLSGLW